MESLKILRRIRWRLQYSEIRRDVLKILQTCWSIEVTDKQWSLTKTLKWKASAYNVVYVALLCVSFVGWIFNSNFARTMRFLLAADREHPLDTAAFNFQFKPSVALLVPYHLLQRFWGATVDGFGGMQPVASVFCECDR